MYRLFGRHAPELTAAIASFAALCMGFYLAWYWEAVWLNRAGSVIIAIGVLLAASRFQEWVQDKARSFIEQNFESVADSAIRTPTTNFLQLPPDEVQRIRGRLHVELHRELNEIYSEDKRRIRAWEVAIVIVGTLINGFGDWIVTSLQGL